MTPSADRAASKAASGKVVPRWRKAPSPIEAVGNPRPRANPRSASRRTATVAALISGPIPSPSITTNLITDHSPDVVPAKALRHAHSRQQTRAMFGVGTAFPTLAPKGRGWGEGLRFLRIAPPEPPHPTRRGERVRGSAPLKTRALRMQSNTRPPAHRLANLLGAPGGFGHEEAHVGLRGDEADALLDESELTLQVALAAEPGKLALRG